MSEKLNQDLHTRVVMRTHDMAWQASPSPSVWRKRLDLVGPAEAGRVTSVVRYDAASTFDAHDHPDGEEILVLAGTFSDEHGHYPQGTFVLNPQGFRHAPYSEDGCILFVKLRQYPGTDRVHVAVDTASAPWVAEGDPGRCVIHLYADPAYPESIHFTRLDAGTHVPSHEHPGGNEMFVLEGSIEDEFGRYEVGDWIRSPAGSVHQPWTDDGCVLYVKEGHLPR